MTRKSRLTKHALWFVCGMAACTSATLMADLPKICAGKGSQCFVNPCSSPCDGKSCCETTHTPWFFCIHADEGECTEVQVDCADRNYFIGGACSKTTNKCSVQSPNGSGKLKTSGCVVPPSGG